VRVDDIGQLLGWSEFWKFRYDGCGHETFFPRDHSVGYDTTIWIVRAIRQYHATCWECAHPQPDPPPPPPDPLWWLQDVHADRHPVRIRPRAVPVALNRHRVVIEGVFPDLVRLRLPDWSADVPLYVERKTLPPEVDAHLLEAGYRLVVDANLDALTPEQAGRVVPRLARRTISLTAKPA
jgi:hypothetical protein